MQLFHGRFKKLLLTSVFTLVLAAPCLCPGRAEARGAASGEFVPLGSPRRAPDFSLEDLNGKTRNLKDFRGRTVLLHFWASWCDPCREEFPALKGLWRSITGEEKSKSNDLVILAVAEDSAERVAPFVNEHGVEFPVLLDQYGGVMRDYGVSVIPVSVVIDGDGMIRAVFVGPRDYSSDEAREFFKGISSR